MYSSYKLSIISYKLPMRYLCTECNYIYDESLGDSEEWIKSWTAFYSLWDYFTCPVCGETKDSFHEITEQINYIEDENSVDFMELDHFMEIYKEEWLIEVKIWKEMHPSWEDHRITEISLYDEYGDLVETKFIEVWEEPEVQFDISDLDDYELRVRCSLHWVWWRKIKN